MAFHLFQIRQTLQTRHLDVGGGHECDPAPASCSVSAAWPPPANSTGTGSAIAPLASAGESTVAASLFIGTPTACCVHASNSAFGLVSSGLPVIPAWSLAAESSVPAASFQPHLTVICVAASIGGTPSSIKRRSSLRRCWRRALVMIVMGQIF